MTSYYTRAIVLTVLYVLALTLAYGPAYASFVQLHISPAAEYRSGRLIFHVLITNAGSECARSPRIEVRLAEHTLSRDLGTDLAAGFSTRITLETDQPPIPPGTHTAIVMVCYDDANGYPYTALAPVPVVTAEPPTALPLVDLRLLDSEFHEKGCISARLRTTSSVPLNVRVKLFLPEELRLREEPVSAVQVVPGRESRLTFAIENRWAMPVSRYIVVATADYLADGRHASAVATSRVIVRGPRFIPVIPPRWGICLSVFCFIVCAAMRFSKREISGPGAARQDVGDWAVVTALVIFLLYHFPLRDLVSETLTVGGDTPAHHYLASHLRERLRHGKGIISWAGGWWCGFPMFQFYFCLPYLVIALLGFAIPHSIAFKLVSVLGILGLPPAAYVAGRIMRLPRPMPLLSAMATIPLLFDSSHTMWGVNIFSTLAGMIANSLSFPLMLLAIASMVRDCSDGFLRIRTVLLLAAMLASHFFTSVIAALTLVALPVAEPNAGLKKTILIPLAEGILALSLMAWWLVPLVAKREYAVDFGENWNISLLGTFPRFVLWLLPLACVSLAALFHRGTVPPVRRQIVLSCWMLVVSTALFLAGSKFSSVFVNVRLWPFIWHSLLCLSAMGMGILLMRHTQGRAFALTGILILTLSHGAQNSARVYAWARWNYSGLERKPRWPVWEKLVLPLKGTPGRLANDLHEENNSLGSTRIFESVPHVIRKPILEGGIVNSAVGALFAYYVQSETSQSCAGFPPLVSPASFNMTNATAHLELFNVKHFIARSPQTRKALANSPNWRLRDECQGWSLYELTTHDGSYVFVPELPPMAVRTTRWKEAALHWLYTVEALNQPFVLLHPNDPVPPELPVVLSEEEYERRLEDLKQKGTATHGTRNNRNLSSAISNEMVTDDLISFDTKAVGCPHIVKCTYYPNWKLRDGGPVFMVSPCFMLIYPRSQHVELYYGSTTADNLGRFLTLTGVGLVGAVATKRILRRKTVDEM